MLYQALAARTLSNLPYIPNDQQQELITRLARFVLNGKDTDLFLLTGYAGTGKTSLVGALVKTLDSLKFKTVLLAPTGRAAKVFAHYAHHPAYTIHRKIYRQQHFSPDMRGFLSGNNTHRDTLFIVDEASMIANAPNDSGMYGSGQLLDDLIEYVYGGENCRLLLLGDTAQLPPVGQAFSPALSPEVLRSMGMNVISYELNQVARQDTDSGILFNATQLRHTMTRCNDAIMPPPQLRFSGFPDVVNLSGEFLIETLSDSFDSVGLDNTIVITRSNKRAGIFNQGIRNQILYREEELTAGDMLLVAKNNYYWGKEYNEVDFIANGDIARVVRVRKQYEMYGFRFADVQLQFPDLEVELEARILLDTLHSDAPALSREQNEQLYTAILADYAHISTQRERMQRLKVDPWFNALQVKYAYGVTCHKAQGGQWRHAYIDMGYIDPSALTLDFYRWLYTAITRATERVYFINVAPPFIDDRDNEL
ncbi:MAG: AAA family ATPase [Bacteroidaceae bacterium]|nr:AAA family ATPase [Bacteroidaceae bacterium]